MEYTQIRLTRTELTSAARYIRDSSRMVIERWDADAMQEAAQSARGLGRGLKLTVEVNASTAAIIDRWKTGAPPAR